MLKRLVAYSVRAYSTSKYIEEIPHGSTVMIGGYLNEQVPFQLIEMLCKADCHELTLVTNTSIADSTLVKSLFKMHGKVKRLVTCLEKNRAILFDKDIKYPFQLDFMRTGAFLDQVSKRRGDYALIRAPLADHSHNLLWPHDQPDYFNRSYATLASCYAIAQAGQIVHLDSSQIDANNQLDRLFVKQVILESDTRAGQVASYAQSDMITWEVIVKRLLLELQNEENVYFAHNVNSLIKSFYEPKHIHLNRLNSSVTSNWPSNYAQFLNYVNRMSLCVVKAQRVDKNGHVSLDSSQLEDCMAFDMIEKSSSTCRLIAVMNFNDLKKQESSDSIINNVGRSLMLKHKPDMVITNRGVFRPNKQTERLELVEYYGAELSEIDRCIDLYGIEAVKNKESLKLMAQECI